MDNTFTTNAQAYLAAIIESSDDAIISKDLNGFITSWNRSAERIFGYTAAEVIGRHITVIIPAERLSEEDKILTTLKTGNRIEHYETVRRHKDGHLIPVSLTVSPIRNAEGTIIGASKVSRDISERINAETALQDMSRKKDEFMANMSHELRTPMNAVIGLASLLKAVPDLPPKAIKYVDVLQTSAGNLMALINDLLDFAKLEADSIQIENVEFNLAEQIERVTTIAHIRAQERGLGFYVNLAPTLRRYFVGDPLRIYQILVNLMSNAFKFTEVGSISLDIRGTFNKDEKTTLITFELSDTGIGIAQEKIGAIFEKFTQADASITRKYGGSGLGLSITKSFVEKMGGTIHVKSQWGLGSVFTVTLPLINTNKIPDPKSFPVNKISEATIQERHVLLVDDYEPNLLVAGEMLAGFGYDYVVARNGFEALRKFVSGKYDIILMDIQMHELDGLEAARRIRTMEADKGLKRTPIIAMTAHVREQDKEKCIQAGMDDFIPKPFEPATLEQKLKHYIATPNKSERRLRIVKE